jgi:hypothetical protein
MIFFSKIWEIIHWIQCKLDVPPSHFTKTERSLQKQKKGEGLRKKTNNSGCHTTSIM